MRLAQVLLRRRLRRLPSQQHWVRQRLTPPPPPPPHPTDVPKTNAEAAPATANAEAGLATVSSLALVAPPPPLQAEADPVAQATLVQCSRCSQWWEMGTCVDPDRSRNASGNRTQRWRCKPCNNFGTTLFNTLAGHVGLREQWDQKTPDERETWIKEQRLALQCLGSNAVVKELTQFSPSPRRRPTPRTRRKRTWSREIILTRRT